jgi:hypothetical protein
MEFQYKIKCCFKPFLKYQTVVWVYFSIEFNIKNKSWYTRDDEILILKISVDVEILMEFNTKFSVDSKLC